MSADSRTSTLLAMALIVAASLFTTWIRFHVGNSDPLWLDELHSVWAINRPIHEVADAAASGNQSPLYFWLLALTTDPTSESPLPFRMLSIISSMLSAFSIAGFVWYWSRSHWCAAMSTWLFAIDGNLIFYGSEARPYAFLILLSVWQLFAFLKCGFIREKPNEQEQSEHIGLPFVWLGIMTILSAAVLLIHPTGTLLLASESAVAVSIGLWQKRISASLSVVGCLTFVVFVTFYLQWDNLKAAAGQRDMWAGLSSPVELTSAYLSNFVFLGLLPAFALVTFKQTTATQDMRRTVAISCLVCALLPILLAVASHLANAAPLAMYRYTLISAVIFPIFSGISVGMISRLKFRVSICLAACALAVFAPIPRWTGKGWNWQYGNEFLLAEAPSLLTTKPIRMRYESWDSVTNLVANSDAPIFLFANLLEDRSATDQGLSPVQADYLKFPLAFNSKVSPKRILVGATHAANERFISLFSRLGTPPDEFWVVIRGDQVLVRQILGELKTSLSTNLEPSRSFNIEKFQGENSLETPEWLTTFKVTIDTAD